MPDCTAGDISTIAQAARTHSDQHGLPTSAQEDWRYVNTKVLEKFPPAPALDAGAAIASAQDCLGDLVNDQALWVVDGRLRSESLPTGISLRNTISEEDCSLWQARLPEADVTEAWSFADAHEMLGLHIESAQETPLTIVHVVTGCRVGWRLALETKAGTAADIRLITLHLQPSWLNAGVDVRCGPGSNLRISEWERGIDVNSVGIACHSKRLTIAQDAHVGWASALTGGQCQRHAISAALLGTGADVGISASTLVAHQRQAHHLVRVRHHVGNATSRQAFKTVAAEEGLSSFDGAIWVDHGADGTDAYQAANGLEIGPKARVAARPQLDIFTDEVVASHGATVGQPDQEEVAYLRSRGLDQRTATNLIVRGFLRDGLSGMTDTALSTAAGDYLIDQLEA